jgi:hypothetical protein
MKKETSFPTFWPFFYSLQVNTMLERSDKNGHKNKNCDFHYPRGVLCFFQHGSLSHQPVHGGNQTIRPRERHIRGTNNQWAG